MAVALAVVILAVLGILFGLGLAMASQAFAVETDSLGSHNHGKV